MLIPGSSYVYSNADKPTTALGVSQKYSYLMRGKFELGAPPADIHGKKQDLSSASVVARVKTLYALLAELTQRSIRTNAEVAAARHSLSLSPDDASLKERLKSVQDQATAVDTLIADYRMKYLNLLETDNLIVMEWSTDEQVEGSVDVGEPGRLSGKSSDRKKGIAVLGGFRVSIVHFGEDYMKFCDNRGTLSSWMTGAFGSTITYMFEAQYSAYTASLDAVREVQLALDIPVNEGASLKDVISDIDRVKLTLLAKQMAALSNTGNMHGGKWERIDLDFCNPTILDNELSKLAPQQDGWLVISAVASRPIGLSFITSALRDFGVLPTMHSCRHCPDSDTPCDAHLKEDKSPSPAPVPPAK
jgi:hypothetical protein